MSLFFKMPHYNYTGFWKFSNALDRIFVDIGKVSKHNIINNFPRRIDMDLSSVMTTLMSSDALKNISKKTGSSESEVSDVLKDALPLLLAGAGNQAKDESTAESFAKALVKHSANDVSDLNGFFDGVDMEDGAKIIGHLLGSKNSSTTKKVSKSSGASANNTEKILAAAAPLLMSLLGQETKTTTKKKSSKNDNSELIGTVVSAVLENVDVADVLTGLLTDKDEKKTTKKTSATKKSTTAKKSSTTKKSSTAKKTTTKKKSADDDGFDIGDAAGLLMNLLK